MSPSHLSPRSYFQPSSLPLSSPPSISGTSQWSAMNTVRHSDAVGDRQLLAVWGGQGSGDGTLLPQPHRGGRRWWEAYAALGPRRRVSSGMNTSLEGGSGSGVRPDAGDASCTPRPWEVYAAVGRVCQTARSAMGSGKMWAACLDMSLFEPLSGAAGDR